MSGINIIYISLYKRYIITDQLKVKSSDYSSENIFKSLIICQVNIKNHEDQEIFGPWLKSLYLT